VINNDKIYVNDTKKLLVLDIDANYISKINYTGLNHIKLPFCVDDWRIYLSSRDGILIYGKKIKN
jgi:hypothetical protein